MNPQTQAAPDNALYDGPSHADGGIPVIVDNVKPIEVEGDEYKICSDAYYSSDRLDFKQKTNLEVLDYIHNQFSCKFDQNKAASTDFIICKVVVRDPKKHDRSGTVQEILDAIQNEGNCKLSTGELGDGKKMEGGGIVVEDYQLPNTLVHGDLALLLKDGGRVSAKIIKNIFKPYMTEEQLAKKWNVAVAKVKYELKKGMQEERDHSDLPEIQRIIVLQHLEQDMGAYKGIQLIINNEKLKIEDPKTEDCECPHAEMEAGGEVESGQVYYKILDQEGNNVLRWAFTASEGTPEQKMWLLDTSHDLGYQVLPITKAEYDSFEEDEDKTIQYINQLGDSEYGIHYFGKRDDLGFVNGGKLDSADENARKHYLENRFTENYYEGNDFIQRKDRIKQDAKDAGITYKVIDTGIMAPVADTKVSKKIIEVTLPSGKKSSQEFWCGNDKNVVATYIDIAINDALKIDSKPSQAQENKSDTLSPVSILNQDTDLKGNRKASWMLLKAKPQERHGGKDIELDFPGDFKIKQKDEEDDDTNDYFNKFNKWIVYEKSSGLMISEGRTQESAIANANQILADKFTIPRFRLKTVPEIAQETLDKRRRLAIRRAWANPDKNYQSEFEAAILDRRMTAADAKAIIESAGLEPTEKIETLVKIWEATKRFVEKVLGGGGGGAADKGLQPLSSDSRSLTEVGVGQRPTAQETQVTNLGQPSDFVSNDNATAIANELQQAYDKAILELVSSEEAKLADLKLKLEMFQIRVKEIYEAEKTASYAEKQVLFTERTEIRAETDKLGKTIIHQENVVKALKNGGTWVQVEDKKGVANENIPSFVGILDNAIDFDEKTILTKPKPNYIPEIDLEQFRRKGYVFDCIRIGPDTYILAVHGYTEKTSKSNHWRNKQGEQEDYYPSSDQQGYVLLTLDQMVLVNQYYTTYWKALHQAEADKKSKANEDYYDQLSRDYRDSYLGQHGFYFSLPAAIQKKMTQDQWLALSLGEKEKIHKPYKRFTPQRIKAELREGSMWVSFHNMYERFVNPEALPVMNRYSNAEVSKYWKEFRDFMHWKMLDLKVQRESDSEMRRAALETSFGASNTNAGLLDKYGILVKRQNGDDINPAEVEQIRTAWIKVNALLGNRYDQARNEGLKISHTGERYVFASKAIGMFIPSMHTIAVSAKYGDQQFENTLAHEFAHWLDYTIGHEQGRRWATDDYESLAGQVAIQFRKHMNKETDSEYLNATKECFARAMQQYFAITNFGDEAALKFVHDKPLDQYTAFFSEGNYVSKKSYYEIIKPLVEAFLATVWCKDKIQLSMAL